MKYIYEDRLQIGKKIYEGDLSYLKAAEQYNLNPSTARSYERLYREENHLPKRSYGLDQLKILKESDGPSYEEILSMTEKEKTQALIKSEIERLRLKKGYWVEIISGVKVFKN